MVRFYICGGSNPGDPAPTTSQINDPYLLGKKVTSVFKEGFRELIPGVEWNFSGQTITVLGGSIFYPDEVFIVNVGLLFADPDSDGTGNIVSAIGGNPFLPYILKGVIQRVDAVFSQRAEDPFNVFYGYGIEAQMYRDVYKSESAGIKQFPLVWLVMEYTEQKGRNFALYSQAQCTLIIAVPTQSGYSMQEREEVTFKPFLIPIYAEVINQISRDKRLQNPNPLKIEHVAINRPYWGMAKNADNNAENLFKNNVDAIEISGLQLNVKHYSNC